MSETLIRSDGTLLVYDRFEPANSTAKAGVVFFHGFKSERTATKVSHIGAYCREKGIPFVCFDFFAHGQSGGAWDDFTISTAVDDALTVIDKLTTGPQILIGSSMGGWVALRVMEKRPKVVTGMVGIAAAPDFTKWVERNSTPEKRRAEGFTDKLMADAHAQTVMDEDWAFKGPVHLLQGQKDDDVPWWTAEEIRQKFPDPTAAKVTLVPDGDHRLNRPEDLALLTAALEDVLNRL